MAKSNPNIPTVDILQATPVNQYVLMGVVTGVPPAGAAYAGIFAPDAILMDYSGSGIYRMSGTTAVPAWTLVNANMSTAVTSALGTLQNSTPTAAQLLGGIVTQTGATGAGTVTLPDGTTMSAAVTGVAVGVSFETQFANLGGGQTLTITGATGMTVIGNGAIPTGKTARLKFVNTGANTWNVYVTVSA